MQNTFESQKENEIAWPTARRTSAGRFVSHSFPLGSTAALAAFTGHVARPSRSIGVAAIIPNAEARERVSKTDT